MHDDLLAAGNGTNHGVCVVELHEPFPVLVSPGVGAGWGIQTQESLAMPATKRITQDELDRLAALNRERDLLQTGLLAETMRLFVLWEGTCPPVRADH